MFVWKAPSTREGERITLKDATETQLALVDFERDDWLVEAPYLMVRVVHVRDLANISIQFCGN